MRRTFDGSRDRVDQSAALETVLVSRGDRSIGEKRVRS